ncbi:M15 family metallopeptidase [Cryptosporangium phraense]|uniref:M15 family metallopeptidase n=2 Tax=Cryptosporangium phraense TaxID=2593070 RepID=A0A545AKC1_9ACTN|nr:M15 family metallopeptidase [Cryptosporangium phraense]
MVLLSDPVIAAISTHDNREPAVDASAGTGLRLDRREARYNALLHYVRLGLRDRLVLAQRALPPHTHLLLVEGYRPPGVQHQQYTAYADLLAARNPGWDPDLVRREASRFISPPEVAPHCTGGAIDLTLCADDGTELDMGTEVNASPVATGNRCYTSSPDISAEAAANRATLSTALTEAGLVNYPTEWWHWSYGDRYWAYTNSTTALYAPLATDQVVTG